MSGPRRLFLLALLLDLLGSVAVLLIASRTWQTVRTPQPSRTDVLDVSGRTIDSASTALGLVALAGLVAVLATRGVVRRVVGAVLALAGVGLLWRALLSARAVGTGRARSLVESAHRTVSADGVVPRVATHGQWPLLSALCGAVVLVAGLLLAWRGHRGQELSSRYESPVGAAPAQYVSEDDAARARSAAATTLWTALDRGEDPTR